MEIYLNAMSEGLLWGLMGIGLYLSFRVMRFADLTSEASFTMGASVAVTLTSSGVNPFLATLMAMIAGSVAGFVTGFLTTVFDIPGLLASIITLTGLYSINLRIMGKPNASFRGVETVFSVLEKNISSDFIRNLIVGLVAVIAVVVLLDQFLKTDFGQAIIATGDNSVMALSLGIPVKQMMRINLMIANSLIALSGSLIAQNNGFSDISMGTGTVVVAMAAIVIGEVLFRHQISLVFRLLTIVIGAIIYRLILVFVLKLGMNPNDFRLISAFVLAVFLAFPKFTSWYHTWRQSNQMGRVS